MTFDLWIGVDQTGAATRGGKSAKPLPCALARPSGRRGLRVELGTLPGATREDFADIGADGAKPVALLLDCVIGLPRGAVGSRFPGEQGAWELFRMASLRRGAKGELYGREVARQFFAQFWEGSQARMPRRRCESLAGANSVFQVHPFQKNIQTGTFRIWRELGQGGKPWARIWPFAATSRISGNWIFEAYPSLMWKIALGLRTRSLPNLERATREACEAAGIDLQFRGWSRLRNDADLADAFVLAVGGAILDRQDRLLEPWSGFAREGVRALASEGWIAGLSSPAARG
jgi:hypothetical protein